MRNPSERVGKLEPLIITQDQLELSDTGLLQLNIIEKEVVLICNVRQKKLLIFKNIFYDELSDYSEVKRYLSCGFCLEEYSEKKKPIPHPSFRQYLKKMFS